jgi:hypothetical protein
MWAQAILESASLSSASEAGRSLWVRAQDVVTSSPFTAVLVTGVLVMALMGFWQFIRGD